jgi:hypothetical protein
MPFPGLTGFELSRCIKQSKEAYGPDLSILENG